jgi:hypothetical protein
MNESHSKAVSEVSGSVLYLKGKSANAGANDQARKNLEVRDSDSGSYPGYAPVM